MNFIKRGLLSIKRRLGKSIILLILIFVLGNVIAGAISIKQAVKNTEINLRKSMGAVTTLQLDYEKIEKQPDFDYNKLQYVSADTINQVGALEYVKYYDYSSSTSLRSTTLKRYTNQDNTYYTPYDYEYISLSGVQNAELLDLKEEKSKLIQGRVFTEEEIRSGKNVIIISNKFAELNELTLGSTITLKNAVTKPILEDEWEAYALTGYTEEIIATQDIEFEVIGIFETAKEVQKDSSGMLDANFIDEEKQNKIYTPNQVIKNINNFQATEIAKLGEKYQEYAEQYGKEYLTPIFILNDPLDIEDFAKEAEVMLPEYYMVEDNSETFNKIAAPMKNMEWISNIVLYVAIGATVIILSLLITLFLRDRKHEVGIYLALGEKKKKIVSQIVLEVVIVAFIGITVSLFSGNIIANSMSKTMLKNQIVAEQEKSSSDTYVRYSSLDWLGYGANISTDDLIENYRVSLSLSTVLIFYAIGIGTVLVSTLIPIIYITRLNPKKIMM